MGSSSSKSNLNRPLEKAFVAMDGQDGIYGGLQDLPSTVVRRSFAIEIERVRAQAHPENYVQPSGRDETIDLDSSRLGIAEPEVFETLFDTRDSVGELHPVINQTPDICWALVTAEAVGIADYKYTGGRVELLDLSVQELLDRCKPNEMINYVNTFTDCYDYIREKGILPKTSYHTSSDGEKNPGTMKTLEEERISLFISGTYCISPEDEIGLENALKTTGSVACGLQITREFRCLGRDEVYEGGNHFDYTLDRAILNHAVLIVAMGITRDNKEYWEIKNSWGTGWGNNGYGKILRRKNILIGAEMPLFG